MIQAFAGPVRAVIFDWSGTIVDHGCVAPAVAFVELFRREGIDLTIEEARGPMGTYKRDHIRTLLTLPAIQEHWRAKHGTASTEADVDALYDRFVPIQMETIASHSDVISGVAESMAWVRGRGIRIGSTTGYFDEAARASREAAALQGVEVDALVCATDVPVARPAPWMILRNLEVLGTWPPAGAVKVGDTPVDIAEGLNAGAWSVSVSRTGNEVGLTEAELAALGTGERETRIAAAAARLRAAGAHYVVEAVADLPSVIEEIDRRLARGEHP